MYCFESIRNNELVNKNISGWNLPVSDKTFYINQGFNGPYSHFKIRQNTDYTHSLDFAVSLNSEVLASKEGIIVFINKDNEVYRGTNFNMGQYFPGNRIILHHDKGIYSLYEHLSKGCFSAFDIYEGKEVKQGETIGSTGLSGWLGPTPHLHFNVFTYIKDSNSSIMRFKTIPIKFDDYKGKLWHKDLNLKNTFH